MSPNYGPSALRGAGDNGGEQNKVADLKELSLVGSLYFSRGS